MADTGWVNVSGEGELELSGGANVRVTFALAHIGAVTSPRVRVIGSLSPKRVQYGGSIGFGGEDTDHNGATVMQYGWSIPLEFERLFWIRGAVEVSGVFVSVVFWKIPPGVDWWIKVVW